MQMMSYQKAVESLAVKPLQQVEYLILYGEFLYSAGFSVSDARDQLIAAADSLLELDSALADEDDNTSRCVVCLVVLGSSAVVDSLSGMLGTS